MYLKIIVALLLCLATLILFSNNNRYKFVGDNLLQNPNFTHSLEKWESGNNKSSVIVGHKLVILQSHNNKEQVYLRQNLEKENIDLIVNVSGIFKLEEIGQGAKKWQKAHFLLVGLNEVNRKTYQEPHFLQTLRGTEDWKEYSKTIKVKADIVKLQFGLQLTMVSGKLWAKELSVRVVEQVKYYREYWIISVTMWAIYFLWISLSYLMAHKLNSRDKVAAIIIAITFIGLLLPDELSGIIKSHIIEVTRFNILLDQYKINCYDCADKIQHFLLFFFITLFLGLGLNNIYDIYRRTILVIVLSFIAEVLQLFVDGRNFELLDFGFGLIGIIGGLFFVYVYHKYVSLYS